MGGERGLREAIETLERSGVPIVRVSEPLHYVCEVADHYVRTFAAVPAVGRGADEPVVLYTNVIGVRMSILMGLFGARERNYWLMGDGAPGGHCVDLIEKPVAPIKVESPPCQENVIAGDLDILSTIPVLKMTDEDTGHFITLGLVLARDDRGGEPCISVHRLCVVGANELTIWMLPGRRLRALYERAVAAGRELPVSINIGGDPAAYLVASFASSFLGEGRGKLALAGAFRGAPVRLSDCVSVPCECLSDAEIVLEGYMTAERADEGRGSGESMPEFLGYPGSAKTQLPKIKVTAIAHRNRAIYQTLVGPGKEQSELQAIPAELMILLTLRRKCLVEVVDAFCSPAGGGLLLAILQVRKRQAADDRLIPLLGREVLALIPFLKMVIVVDDDVNIRCAEDVLWAMVTRFQIDRDCTSLVGEAGFPMDPSQLGAYYCELDGKPRTAKVVLDCTAPWSLRHAFRRSFQLSAEKLGSGWRSSV